MAQALDHMRVKAFDALLYYGVNYQTLPEFRDRTLMDEAERLTILQGRQKYLLWLERLEHGIDAAIRRKTFHHVT